MSDLYKVTRVQRGTKGLILLNAPMPAHAFLHIYSIWVSNVSFSSSRTPKYLLEVTRETKLLSMEITLGKSPDLVFKLYVDPTTIILVLRGWNWSLLTVSQSLRFFKSEFILLARAPISKLEVKILVSSAYKQGVVNFKQFGKRRGPRIEPWGTPQSKLLWEDKQPFIKHCCCRAVR